MRDFKGYAKFFMKVYVIGIVRDVLIFFIGGAPNRTGWKKRVLIINLDLIGDLAMFTSVLKHYKEALPGKEVFLLINTGTGLNSSTGMSSSLLAPFVDRVIGISNKAFTKNPLEAAKIIRSLRAIGFRTVIDHQPGVVGIIEKTIAVSLGAEEVIGYEGVPVELARPTNSNVKFAGEYVKKHLFPRFSKVVKSIEGPYDPSMKRFPGFIRYYDAVFEAATGVSVTDNVTTLSVDDVTRGNMERLLKEHGVVPGSYCLVAPGTSGLFKTWETEKFTALMKSIKERGIPIVLTGSAKDQAVADIYQKELGDGCVSLIGKTSVEEFVALVSLSLFCFGNDSAIAHVAVALKKPSLIILGLGHLGMVSLYGYRDINRWVYAENQPCLCDNWECRLRLTADGRCPCIAAISVEQARTVMTSLLDYLASAGTYPKEKFAVEF